MCVLKEIIKFSATAGFAMTVAANSYASYASYAPYSNKELGTLLSSGEGSVLGFSKVKLGQGPFLHDYSFTLASDAKVRFDVKDKEYVGFGINVFDNENLEIEFASVRGETFITDVLTGDTHYHFKVKGTSIGESGGVYTGSVSAVPIPAAAWLFGSAVLGLAGVSRCRNQKASYNAY